MQNSIYSISEQDRQHLNAAVQTDALQALESGQVLFIPSLTFQLKSEEQALLSASILAPKEKNISYHCTQQKLGGLHPQHQKKQAMTQAFMHRFALFAQDLIEKTLPHYQHALKFGRTSYRPAEIAGRKTSKRKDDTRLHVDSFSATPVNGLRILRVFCNINPEGKPRVWQVGEPFPNVLANFAARIPAYSARRAKWLLWTKTTKTLRGPYDHYMLHLHDNMKLDDDYQASVTKQCIDFPAQSTWLVFTDHVSHAALSGQFLLEQTFYLPVEAMKHPALSPFQQWKTLHPTELASLPPI